MKPFHNPFGALGEQFGIAADQTAPEAGPKPIEPAPAPAKTAGRSIPRAVVRIERTGRGGKEVTVVEQLDLQPTERDRWLKALKAALGCGGVVEGNALVLQGDHRDRLPAILTARGVRKTTVAR